MKDNTPSKFFLLLFLFSVFWIEFALPQEATIPAKTDSSVKPSRSSSGLEGPVKYTADKIYFSTDEEKTYLEGNVKIDYQNISLTAGKVSINWNKYYMRAEGIVDSTDSLGNPVYKNLPVLTEKGTEPIEGFSLEYNFKTQRGKVFEGKTNMEPGYYKGKEAEKVGKETLFIKDGYFTTCENENHPHYFFRSSQMRIRARKFAVAKPIILYIADIPVMAIPFGLFPLAKGRRSGIIIPTFGQNSYGGRYLERFGFYWAPAQYWDATLLMNFYEKTGLLYSGEVRYKLRYKLSGNLAGSYTPKDVRTGEKRERWGLRVKHQQTINQTTTLDVSGAFQSDKDFRKDYYSDLDVRLNQNLSASALLRKTWTKSRNSMSVSVRRNENLQTGQIDYELPNVSYTQPTKSLFGFLNGVSGQDTWQNSIKYSYNTQLLRKGSRTPQSDTTFIETDKAAWRHNFSFTSAQKVFKYINVSPSLNFQALFVPEYLNYSFVDSLNSPVPDTVKEVRGRYTFDLGVSARTTFYGIWNIPFSPLKVVRHKMDPSVGISFEPDFSDPFYGYYQTFTDSSENKILGDRFAGNLFGNTPRDGAANMKFGLANTFQGKILKKEEEKKIDLFRVSTNTSYNFKRDSVNWSRLGTNLSAKPHRNFDFTMVATHSLYRKSSTGGDKNEFIWENSGFKLPRLTNWEARLNGRINLKPPREKAETEEDSVESIVPENLLYQEGIEQDITLNRQKELLKDLKTSWNINFNFTYSYSWNEISRSNERFDVTVDAKVQPTKNWRIQYYASIDAIKKNLNYQRINIYRDLHCWEMLFEWAPNPGFSYYRFEIRIKEPILRDLRLTKTADTGVVF